MRHPLMISAAFADDHPPPPHPLAETDAHDDDKAKKEVVGACKQMPRLTRRYVFSSSSSLLLLMLLAAAAARHTAAAFVPARATRHSRESLAMAAKGVAFKTLAAPVEAEEVRVEWVGCGSGRSRVFASRACCIYYPPIHPPNPRHPDHKKESVRDARLPGRLLRGGPSLLARGLGSQGHPQLLGLAGPGGGEKLGRRGARGHCRTAHFVRD